MVGWHHQFHGQEFEQTLGDGEGQRSLACCRLQGRKESDMMEQLNNNSRMNNVPQSRMCSLLIQLMTATGYIRFIDNKGRRRWEGLSFNNLGQQPESFSQATASNIYRSAPLFTQNENSFIDYQTNLCSQNFDYLIGIMNWKNIHRKNQHGFLPLKHWDIFIFIQIHLRNSITGTS